MRLQCVCWFLGVSCFFCVSAQHAQGAKVPTKISPFWLKCEPRRDRIPAYLRAASRPFQFVKFIYSDELAVLSGTGVHYPGSKSRMQYGGLSYQLQSVYFHVPPLHSFGSKNLVRAEMHVVHYSPRHGFAIVSVPLQKGSKNFFFQEFLKHMPDADSDVHKKQDEYSNMADLIPTRHGWLVYDQNPRAWGCAHNKWFLLDSAVSLSEEQLTLLSAHRRSDEFPKQVSMEKQSADKQIESKQVAK